MKKWILREKQRSESKFNAGSKARYDVDKILLSSENFCPLVVNEELDLSNNPLKKIYLQFSRYFEWKNSSRNIKSDDVVVLQYPVRNHTIFLSKIIKKMRINKVKTVGFIHDLEFLRQSLDKNISVLSRIRFYINEIYTLKQFSIIIVHNNKMKETIHQKLGIPLEKMISLDIFDYIYQSDEDMSNASFGEGIIIAGSLDKTKAGYIYSLPNNVEFRLYGANLDSNQKLEKNVLYCGKSTPDELPALLKGSFGLVWDGSSTKTCEGVFGEYLKINNPHKTSLYLAAGIPVIVWDKSAISDFVQRNNCGLIIENLDELSNRLSVLSKEEYNKMVMNAKEVGRDLRMGKYTIRAIRKALDDYVENNRIEKKNCKVYHSGLYESED